MTLLRYKLEKSFRNLDSYELLKAAWKILGGKKCNTFLESFI